jgi:hypothetical protein
MSNIPITPGSGAASVAAETIGGLSYQQIEVFGAGGASVLGINPDGSAKVSIVGTISTTFTGTPSVSGTVNIGDIKQSVFGASIIGVVPATITNTSLNVSGSVAAFLPGNASVITVAQSSVAVAIISGSIATTSTPPANQSVSGTVGASIIGSVPVTGFPTNQSVSGSLNTTISSVGTATGLVPVNLAVAADGDTGIDNNTAALILGGAHNSQTRSAIPFAGYNFNGSNWDRVRGNSSIGTLVSTGASSVLTVPLGTQNVSGSVVTFQGTNPYIITGSVQASITPAANQSVSGTVGASVIGHAPVFIIGGSIATGTVANQSVSGTVNVGNFPTIQNVSGSVVATQGTNPWIITGSVQGSFSPAANQSVSGTVGASVIGTVPIVQSGTNITSIVSTVPSSVIVGASIFGQLPAGTAPLGSVAVLQGTNPFIITGSVQGSFSPSGNQSVSGALFISGSVLSQQTGTVITSLVSTVPSSVIVGASIFGLAPVNVTNTNVNVSGSVAAFNISTNASFISVSKDSSVVAILQNPSIAGTFAEDAAHTSGDKGIFVLTVRNDTMASITSVDGDYSPNAVGPVGERIVSNAPITKWVQGTADLRTNSGTSVAVIAAQGASIFTYITGVQLANMGSASVLVTFSGATSSVIGYSIAPAGGGSNIVYPNALKTNANGAFTASISGVASVLVSAQGFISKT